VEAGVENELWTPFQRLARYPGVDVKDLITVSGATKELLSLYRVEDECRLSKGGREEGDSAVSCTSISELDGHASD
jgi:hypothetical protein